MFTVTLALLIFISVELHRPPSCLVPGAGLGRLALEISSLGTEIKFSIKNWAKVLWELLIYFLMFVFFFWPWTGFASQGNEFSYYMLICSSFILNQYDNLINISYTSAIYYYSYFIMLMIFPFLPAPKRLKNGLYILGYTVTAILFQTMINFDLFHFLIFIPQGTYYPMSIISA